MSTYCGQCGAEMEEAAGFCGKCGTSTDGQAAATLQPGGILVAREVEYPKAGLWRRLGASLLDGIIGGSLAIVGLIIGLDNTLGEVIYFIGYIAGLVYAACKDGLNEGQSYGKKLLGLRVVLIADNKPCTKVASLLRFIMLMIPFVPIVECVMVLATDKGRRLGDKLAKTQVIMAEDYRA